MRYHMLTAKLPRNRSNTTILPDIEAQLLKLSETAKSLDGAELESLKHEITVFYWLLLELKEAASPDISRAFILSLYEQELLSIQMCRSKIPEAVQTLRSKLSRNDIYGLFTGFGRIAGAIMTEDELLNREVLL